MPKLSTPTYQERVVFLGENGSGKTYLANAMLSAGNYARWIVLDQKRDFTPFEGAGDYRVVTEAKPEIFHGWRRADRILFQPKPEYGPRAIRWALHQCYIRANLEGKRRPFIVLVDEGLDAAHHYASDWLRTIATTGRSLGCGLWVNSQRPRWIPREVLSEAWRIYVFYMGNEEDDKEIVRLSKSQLTLADVQAATSHYSFLELRRDPDRAGPRLITRYPPIKQQE